MIPDFPHICLAKLNWDSQLGRDIAMSGCNKKIIGPILFLYYKESLVSSNLNSKLFRFPIFKKQNNLPKFLYPSLENLTTQNSTLCISNRLFFTLKCCCDIHKETWSSVLDNGRFILEFAWSLLFDRMNYATIKLL